MIIMVNPGNGPRPTLAKFLFVLALLLAFIVAFVCLATFLTS